VNTGQCNHQLALGCCVTGDDCPKTNPCVATTCGEDNACESNIIPGCCIANVECEDGDECTYNQCIDNVCVAPVDIPGCCFGVVLGTETFDDGLLIGWEFELVGDVNWQVSGVQSLSAPNALWFGNPLTGDYSEFDDTPPAGSVTSSPYVIPSDKYAKATFSVWADIELPLAYDQIDLKVLNEDNVETVVWDKSALVEQQSWQTFQINLSSFAGQTVRLQWSFDAVDAVSNDGQGVFIDDIAVQTFCDPVDTCVFNTECDDGDACTSDICVSGVCVHEAIVGCCTSDAECDDEYLCTLDSCVSGSCVYDVIPSCCQFGVECDDGNVCTTDLCVENTCVYEPDASTDGCCLVDIDCDDADTCTDDACIANTCQYSASGQPDCCIADVVLAANFDDATLGGFEVLGGGTEAGWSVQSKRYFSAPFSLYFGIPGEWTYSTNPASSGIAISPEFTVPVTADSATLKFATWVDIGSLGFVNDIFDVRVLSGSKLTTVWAYSNTSTETQWEKVSVDLSEYKGQTIRLYWNFQSQDGFSSSIGEGVYLDTVSVSTECAP